MNETTFIEIFSAPMNLFQGIILLVLSLGLYWLIAYFRKSGSNTAEKKDKRGISYEGKKGENIADEEDQVSQTQKERLVKILYIAEKINQSQNKYFLYLYDLSNRTRLDKLVEDINELLTDLYHEQRLANIFLPEEQQKMMDELVTNASGIVVELSTNSSNAGNCISAFNHFMDYANIHKEEQSTYWEHSRKTMDKIEEFKKKKLMFKEEYQQSIQKYANWLGEYIKQNIKVMG